MKVMYNGVEFKIEQLLVGERLELSPINLTGNSLLLKNKVNKEVKKFKMYGTPVHLLGDLKKEIPNASKTNIKVIFTDDSVIELLIMNK